MGIPIGKLSLYTACGGISPAYTLPVVLDVGTNNPDLLNDPMYMGWRHERVSGAQYEEFVDLFIQAIKRRWPNVLLQFEDFAQTNAMPLLERYRTSCAASTTTSRAPPRWPWAPLLAACKAKGEKLSEQTVTFVGAGSAGCGIAEQIIAAMQLEGPGRGPGASAHLHGRPLGPAHRRHETCSTSSTAWRRSAPISVPGAPAGRRPGVAGSDPQCPADGADRRLRAARAVFRRGHPRAAQPLQAAAGDAAVQPDLRVEATPQEILNWTDGQALVATGSPFQPVQVGDSGFPSPSATTPIFPASAWG